MSNTYWQAELYRNGREYDFDFPRRATSDEALADGREAMGRFTASEREHIEYQAAEWTGDDEQATNTGRVAQEDFS